MAVGHELETRSMWVSLDDEGIVRVRHKPQAEIELADALELLATERRLVRGGKHPILVDLRLVKSMTRECRRYLAGSEPAKLHAAGALITATPFGTALGNFFMGINKPIVPTRLFTEEDEGLRWLRGFLPRPASIGE